MIITVTTKADMSNMEKVMEDAKLKIWTESGNTLVYFIKKEDDTTTITIPQTKFVAKKGRINGMVFKLKKRIMLKAIEAECLRNGFEAKVEIT